MVKLVKDKKDYKKLLGSSINDRIIAFLKDETIIYNCKKMTKKSLFSYAEIIYIISNFKISSSQLYNLLLELKDNDIIGYFYKFTYKDKYFLLQLVDRIKDKSKATLALYKLGLLDYNDIEEYIVDYNENNLYELVKYSLDVSDKGPLFHVRMSDILDLSFKNKYDSIFDLCVSNQDVFEMDFFKYLNDEVKLKWIDTYFKIHGPKKELIEYFNMNFFQQAEDMILSDEYYEYLIDAYIKYYKLNEENFNKLFYSFNYCVFKYCYIRNFRKIVNLEPDKLDKILDLFTVENTTLDLDTLNTLSNAFLQRKFRIVMKETYNYFGYFEEMINSDLYSAESILHLIRHMLYEYPTLYKFFENYDLNKFAIELKAGNKEYIDILHSSVQDYIKYSREKYIQENLRDFYNDLNIEKVVDRGWWKKEFLYSKSINELLRDFKELVNNTDYLSKYREFVYSDSFINIIRFRINSRNAILSEQEKKLLRDFEYLLNELYEVKKYEYKIYSDTKVIYQPVHASNYDMLDVISDLDANCISDNLLDDDELLGKLYAYLNKYKFLGWSDTFNGVIGSCDLNCEASTIASLINNFSRISKEIDNNATLTEVIDYCECYDSKSKKYLTLFESEDYKYIVINGGNYRADRPKTYRLEKCKELLLEGYRKECITVPPIDKNYQTNSNKTINVVLGNSTNPVNLTVGERTSSCLRCGGGFNDLFEFCIKDKNGFHIIFNDPNTGRFISRVSGIRNGNTLFLNELRHSVHEGYSDDDLIDILNKAIIDIVNITSKTKNPIENVIITSDYAFKKYNNLSVPNNIDNTHHAFYGQRFNLNANGDCIKLYPKNKPLSYDFYDDPEPFMTQRDKIKRYDNPADANEAIARIEMIDLLLSYTDLKLIKDEVDYDIVYAFVGEDWYVYFDSNNIPHKYIMRNSINKERAMSEIESLNLELDRGLV